jgi:hypothetical protein
LRSVCRVHEDARYHVVVLERLLYQSNLGGARPLVSALVVLQGLERCDLPLQDHLQRLYELIHLCQTFGVQLLVLCGGFVHQLHPPLFQLERLGVHVFILVQGFSYLSVPQVVHWHDDVYIYNYADNL